MTFTTNYWVDLEGNRIGEVQELILISVEDDLDFDEDDVFLLKKRWVDQFWEPKIEGGSRSAP
jgi:hypothetical protein